MPVAFNMGFESYLIDWGMEYDEEGSIPSLRSFFPLIHYYSIFEVSDVHQITRQDLFTFLGHLPVLLCLCFPFQYDFTGLAVLPGPVKCDDLMVCITWIRFAEIYGGNIISVGPGLRSPEVNLTVIGPKQDSCRNQNWDRQPKPELSMNLEHPRILNFRPDFPISVPEDGHQFA